MTSEALLGIDVGTTGTKAVLFKRDGEAVSKGYVEYDVMSPKSGWSEQDPERWWKATQDSVKEAIDKSDLSSDDISAIGLSGQTNGLVLLDENDELLRPCIIWMDRRAAGETEIIEEKIGAKKFHETTGVLLDSFYSICEVLWVMNNEPELFEKAEKILQPKDYIGFKMTGRKVLDSALASNTGLFDTNKKEYAEDILETLDIPIEKFPEIVEPSDVIGELDGDVANSMNLNGGTPIVAGSGDVNVNAIGSGALDVGQAYAKTSTVSDVAVTTDKPITDSKFRFATYGHPDSGKWILMAGATGGGMCYRWFRDSFGQLERGISEDLGKDPYEIMNEEAEQAELGSKGLIFLPYLEGARSPFWDPSARGVYFGLKSEHKKRHLIRAILEGVAYSMRRRIGIMNDELGVEIESMSAVGGGGRSPTWRQIIADVTGKPLALTRGEEHECLGAAILAGVGTGVYSDLADAVDKTITVKDRSEPDSEAYEEYERFYEIYADLYGQLKDSFRKLP